MEKICKEFHFLSLNLTDFILMNKDLKELKYDKLEMIREAMIDHLEECKDCIFEEQPERSKREDSVFVTARAALRAIKKASKEMRCSEH